MSRHKDNDIAGVYRQIHSHAIYMINYGTTELIKHVFYVYCMPVMGEIALAAFSLFSLALSHSLSKHKVIILIK